jgi:hypothetical protein
MELQPGFTLPVSDRREKEVINQSFEQDQGPSTCLEQGSHEAKGVSQILVDIQAVATRTMITIDNATWRTYRIPETAFELWLSDPHSHDESAKYHLP